MKAAIYDEPGSPDVLRYEEVPDAICGPGEVLIRVEAISIEGGDLINRATTQPPNSNHIGGYAAPGTIIALGAEVSDREVGKRVATINMQGSHAELRAAPAAWTWIVPEEVDSPAAAVVPISFGTAHEALFVRGALQPGETVLIQGGTGGVGVAAIQLAKRHGARVLATVSGEHRAARLRALGLDRDIDHRNENVAERVLELTDGQGTDLVLDLVGSTLSGSIAALRKWGRLVLAGNAGGSSTVDLWPVQQANQTVMGVFWGDVLDKHGTGETMEEILNRAASGKLDIVIDKHFPLADAAAAHRYAEEESIVGRVVLLP